VKNRGERALPGIHGYLARPSFRCRTADANGSRTNRKVAYLMDARYDGFLPTVWLAFGLGEPRFDFASARVAGLDRGGFEDYWYSCYLTVQHPGP